MSLIGILFGISLILNLILFYRSYVMVKIVERTQDKLIYNAEHTLMVLENMLKDMRDVDLKGAFESEDEVGAVFQQLITIIKEYKINLERDYGKKEEEQALLYKRD